MQNESGFLDELETGLTQLQNELLRRLEQLELRLNELQKTSNSGSNGKLSCDETQRRFAELPEMLEAWLRRIGSGFYHINGYVVNLNGVLRLHPDLGQQAAILRDRASICNNCVNRFESDAAFVCLAGHVDMKTSTRCTHYDPACDVEIDRNVIAIARVMTDENFLVTAWQHYQNKFRIDSDDPIDEAAQWIQRVRRMTT